MDACRESEHGKQDNEPHEKTALLYYSITVLSDMLTHVLNVPPQSITIIADFG
jgi:hypothetical protein